MEYRLYLPVDKFLETVRASDDRTTSTYMYKYNKRERYRKLRDGTERARGALKAMYMKLRYVSNIYIYNYSQTDTHSADKC